MEALATGLPACISDIEAHRELVKEHAAGFLFTEGNSSRLAQKLEEILHCDYETASTKAREFANNELCAERMTKEYESLYSSIE
jgi:glycosyltransferase involved in cell wall biosynthesis